MRGARFCSFSLRSKTKSAGFTLVELVVAVFIFTVLTMVAGGSFVSALNLQRRALDIKKVEENGRFVLELMTRELRVANPVNTSNTNCPTSPTNTISFQHPVNGAIQYSLNGTQIQRRVNGVDTIISNPDVEATRLVFCISGNTANDNRQPRVTIVLSLKSGGSAVQAASIDLQTTVSQRVLSD
ncbi:MAG: hypothetical protein G01um10142_181 [Parcubacteria group bacterium Gr01-1014_2]|nr:MAG: hypothetical protein G01um10142_181 [Parcubacteria group bacterium Gr01-1014_2]